MNTLETRNTYEQSVPRQRAATPTQTTPRPQGAKKANMPKAQALALTQKLKNGLAVASVLCFGSLGGFLVGHSTLTTTATTTATTQQTTKASQASSTNTNQATTTSSSQTGNTSSTSSTSSSQQQGGSNFGSTSTNQAPVSGSSTS